MIYQNADERFPILTEFREQQMKHQTFRLKVINCWWNLLNNVKANTQTTVSLYRAKLNTKQTQIMLMIQNSHYYWKDSKTQFLQVQSI